MTSACVLVCLDMCDFLCNYVSLSLMTQQWVLPAVASVHVTATGVFCCMCVLFKYPYRSFAAGMVGRVLRRRTLCWRSSILTWSRLQTKA